MRKHFDRFSFGTLRIDGSNYEQDVAIDREEIRKRKKTLSKKFRDEFGHMPLSIEEKIPWKCHRLVIGTGAYGRLPFLKEVKREAERRHVELVISVPTREAIRLVESIKSQLLTPFSTCPVRRNQVPGRPRASQDNTIALGSRRYAERRAKPTVQRDARRS